MAKIWPTRLWSDEKCYLRKNQKTERVGRDENIKRSCLWTDCHSEKTERAGPVKRRIMDMGITKGVSIYVRKVAPLGDPIEVTVRGYELSLRKADAEMIEVE